MEMGVKASEFRRAKRFLLQATPIWIDGVDFTAFNFGDEAQPHSEAGRNSILTSATGSAVVDRRTGAWRFLPPYMRITNVSHVEKFDKVQINLTFEEVRNFIEQKTAG